MGAKCLVVRKTHIGFINISFVNDFVCGNMLWAFGSLRGFICNCVVYLFGLILRYILRFDEFFHSGFVGVFMFL